MNNHSSYFSVLQKFSPKRNWDVIKFKVYPLSGKIGTNIDENEIKRFKISKDEITPIFKKLEIHTYNFYYLKCYNKLILTNTLFILLSLILSFVCFYDQLEINLGYLFLCMTIFGLFVFVFMLLVIRRKFNKFTKKSVKRYLRNINDYFLLEKSLYLMIDHRLNYLCLYIIPYDVGIKIKFSHVSSLKQNTITYFNDIFKQNYITKF